MAETKEKNTKMTINGRRMDSEQYDNSKIIYSKYYPVHKSF